MNDTLNGKTFKELHPDIFSNPIAKSYKSLDEDGMILESWKLENGIWVNHTKHDQEVQLVEIKLFLARKEAQRQRMKELNETLSKRNVSTEGV